MNEWYADGVETPFGVMVYLGMAVKKAAKHCGITFKPKTLL